MPISEEEAFGPTRSAKRKKADETGFIESALAGVATGLINIPKGFVSLGAELFDLIGDTDTATSVEKFFDDLNPFDDEAEARTVGKITTALAQIGVPAFQGAKIGMGLAKKAIDARKIGKYAELSRFGKVINNVKNSQLAGGIGGAAVGEAIVSDEEIGTLGDMLKGTSLEPVAFTMMNRDKKEGREEAFRRLTNRVKFGIDGSIFNLGIAGAGKGINALRRPAKEGLLRYTEGTGFSGGVKELYEKYIKFGFSQAGMLDEVSAEAARRSADVAEAIKFDAGQDVIDLFDTVKEVVPNITGNTVLKNEEEILKRIQKVMQPIPGKKAANITAEKLPDLIESKSGLKNNARKLLEFSETEEGFRRLKTAEGPDGLFTAGDYEIVPGGEFDKLLKDVENTVGGNKGRRVSTELKNLVIKMRNGVDNMTGKLLNKNNQKDMSIKLQSELGNYLTADYDHFTDTAFSFFRTGDAAAAQKQEALKYYTAAKLTEEAAIKKIPIATLKQNADFMNKVAKDGEQLIAKYLTAKNIDDPAIDLLRQDKRNIQEILVDKPRTPSGGIDKAAAKLEDQVIKVNPEILKGKRLNEFEEIIYGRITDPKHTYLSSITKMATLNSTLELMEDVGRIGSKKFLKDGTTLNPGRYIFGDGTEEGAIRELLNIPEVRNPKGNLVPLTPQQTADGLAILNDPKQFKKVEALKDKNLIGLLPLENQYVRAPFYDDIFQTTAQFLNTGKIGAVYKYGVLAPKAVSQITKTILSPITHARNLISAGAFAAANGAIVPTGTDFTSLLPKSLGGDIFQAGRLIDPKTKQGVGLFETAKRITYGRIRGTMTRQDRDLYERLLKIGMVKTNPITGELDRLGQDFYKNSFVDPATTQSKTFRGFTNLVQKGKKAYGKIQDAYVAEDDFWKTITWGLERNRYEDIFTKQGITSTNFKKILEGTETGVSKEMSDYVRQGVKRNFDPVAGTYIGSYDDFLDEFAANLSRNLVPNYAYIGRAGKALRLSPFGNFIAFPLEILRTGSNILEQGIKERATGIPELVSLGNRRILSFGLTVGGIPKIAQESFKAMHDVDNEEMEALRRVVPEWSKNSTLLPMGRDKNGYLKYVDFSYSNAYDTLLRPFNTVFNAIAEGKNDETSLKQSLGEGLQESAVELLKPFTTESIFTEALVDSTIRRGIGREGRRVWDQADDPFIKIVKGFGHVAKSFEPGSYRQLERLGNSLLGKTDPKYGKEYNVFDELPGLAGFGIKTADPERSLVYKTSQFGSDLKKSENLFTSQLLKGGRVSPEDIINRYKYSEQARFQVLKKMAKDVDAMRELGMPDYKIKKELKKRKGLSSKVVSDVMLGVYTPKRPTNFFIERTGEINRDLNRKEGNAVPNPYFKALPVINGIMNKNRRVDLLEGNLGMSDLSYGMPKQEPRITTPNLTSDASINTQVVQSKNTGSTLPANFASLPTAERSKIIEEFFTT